MSKLPLTLACLDYDRVKPLMLKTVEPAGIDLNILPYSPDDSVWPMVRYQEGQVQKFHNTILDQPRKSVGI